ncbi:MAG TPA: phosphoglycerate kinase [Armatimonadota bacterium]|mgnify:CR=1 FL=1|nr:phosphoglycerate kinase [Armatimonadota bacterium]
MAKKSVTDLEVAGKRVLVRVDFNVPLDGQTITDDTRIRAALPTINYLTEHGAKVILVSHLGRPKGGPSPEFRMDPVAKRLSELVTAKVTKLDDCIGPEVEAAVAAMSPGDIILLENSRFHAGEEKNDPELAKKLASLADVFVNDAFGTCHRAHATTEGVTHYVSESAAGFLVQKELDVLLKAIQEPVRPLVAILGGAKVADKLSVIENLLKIADKLIIGGGMAYTFLKAQGYEVGASLLDASKVEWCGQVLERAKAMGKPLLLPVDVVAAREFKADAETRIVPASSIPEGWQGLDAGPETTALFVKALEGAGTIIWNGPTGVFEMEPFAKSTRAIAQAMANSPAITIIGGGDSAAAVTQMGFADQMTHISTGDGASLELMEGLELPGVAALTDK